MKIFYYVFGFMFSLFVLNGCATVPSTVTVLQPNIGKETSSYHSFSTYEIAFDNNMTNEQKTYFKQKLEGLIKEQGFNEGNELTLKYKFLKYNEGNRATRYALGGAYGAGKGVLVIEVEYYNQNNQKVGKVMSDRALFSGVFGGDFRDIVDLVAKEVSDYTLKNYLRK